MLSLKVISPEKVLFTGEVENVLVPGEVGEFEILTNDICLIRILFLYTSYRLLIVLGQNIIKCMRY